MQRLAALVPRPRLHLIRFHGVLAPNAKLRYKVGVIRLTISTASGPAGLIAIAYDNCGLTTTEHVTIYGGGPALPQTRYFGVGILFTEE